MCWLSCNDLDTFYIRARLPWLDRLRQDGTLRAFTACSDGFLHLQAKGRVCVCVFPYGVIAFWLVLFWTNGDVDLIVRQSERDEWYCDGVLGISPSSASKVMNCCQYPGLIREWSIPACIKLIWGMYWIYTPAPTQQQSPRRRGSRTKPSLSIFTGWGVDPSDVSKSGTPQDFAP